MTMHIACSTDERYARPLAGMLASLFAHHPTRTLYIHVLAGALSRESVDRLHRIAGRHQAELQIHPVPEDRFAHLPLVCDHFSTAIFYRLMLPSLVTSTRRILYLDVDLVVRRPLESLFSIELGGRPLAAAPDAYPKKDCARLGIDPADGYFNSGVMLIDLDAWRRENIAGRALAYLEEHSHDHIRCKYGEQDALNVLLQRRWLPVGEQWNFNIYFCAQDPRRISKQRRELLRDGPAIVHFCDARKPWMREGAMPFQKEYLHRARAEGIAFPPRISPAALWVRFQAAREMRKLRAAYRQSRMPWRP